MIPAWRSATTTPQTPALKPVPEVRARAGGKAIKDPFSHFSHTFTNGSRYLRIVDVEYYARFRLSEPFTGLMYMAIFILTADQWPAMPPVFSTLSGLVGALRGLGLGVAVAHINDSVVDIYTWSNRPLSSVRSGIINAIRGHMPSDVTVNAVYYIVGENIMIWNQFDWDDGSVWANNLVLVYRRS
jgi:hypothetical protein